MSSLLAQARLRACRYWSFASHALLSMVPTPRPGLGTLAVDQHWRLYDDEATLQRMSAEKAAGVILHELDHLLKRHHKRGKALVGVGQWEAWNYATDAAINGDLSFPLQTNAVIHLFDFGGTEFSGQLCAVPSKFDESHVALRMPPILWPFGSEFPHSAPLHSEDGRGVRLAHVETGRTADHRQVI